MGVFCGLSAVSPTASGRGQNEPIGLMSFPTTNHRWNSRNRQRQLVSVCTLVSNPIIRKIQPIIKKIHPIIYQCQYKYPQNGWVEPNTWLAGQPAGQIFQKKAVRINPADPPGSPFLLKNLAGRLASSPCIWIHLSILGCILLVLVYYWMYFLYYGWYFRIMGVISPIMAVIFPIFHYFFLFSEESA